VQDSVHPRRLCASMSKWVRLPNAVVCGAFHRDGVGEDEWELPLTRQSRKESQRRGVVVSKARYVTSENATVGRRGDERSAVGVDCAALQMVRLGSDIKWRIADSGNSSSTSRHVRGGPHRSTNSAAACLSSGLGVALGGMYRQKDCRMDGESIDVIVCARGA